MRFTEALRKEVRGILPSILKQPFIKELVSGDLSEDRFKFYVTQDALYLSEFARALSVAAAKAPLDEWVIAFNDHSRGVILVERELHHGFFERWNITEADLKSTPLSPTNVAYTSYLVATAYSRPFTELMGALLPCFWIYWEVGKQLEKVGSRKDIYQKWIDTYSSEQFAGVCRQVLDIANKVWVVITEAEKGLVKKHFVTTSRYEYMFWDSAYRLERWPV